MMLLFPLKADIRDLTGIFNEDESLFQSLENFPFQNQLLTLAFNPTPPAHTFILGIANDL